MDNKEYNFTKICRACLCEDTEMKSVFDLTLSTNQEDTTDFFFRLTSLKITKGDGLPERICSFCIKKIIKAYNFAQLCISTDVTLRLRKNQAIVSNLEKIISNNDKTTIVEGECNERSIQNRNKINENDDEEEENDGTNKIADNKENTTTHLKVQCTECKKSFSNETSLKKHKKLHDPNRILKCVDCDKTFTKKSNLTIHLKTHLKSDEKNFICKVCGQKFLYSYLLKQHSYKHTDVKPFPCTKCDKGCLTAESLRRHMKIHDKNYEKKKHICAICHKEFPYPSFLAEHMKNHTGERPFPCDICGKGFRQKGALRYHMRSHTGFKPFVCEVCKHSFMSRSVLRVHMRRHTNERPYVCDICGMAFRQSTDMKSHTRTHTGVKPVLCTICGKRMSTTGQLTVHIRTHTGEKPFLCKTCAKSFATRTMLVKHERIHTGERPYVCNICGRTFNQSSTLKTHSNTHRNYKEQTPKTNCVKNKVVCSTVLRINDNGQLTASK